MTTVKLLAAALALALAAAACGGRKEAANTNAAPTPAVSKTPGPLPDNGFKAQITLPEAPAKLRAGQKETVQVHIKNASDVFWWARGGETNERNDNWFYIAAGNRWLKPDGSLVTDMDGRYGISKDLKPGEETEIPLTVTAPKEPGDYLLEVDLVQEQVSWFSDKGSPTARAKVTVVR
ncbi:MAG TPA: hypothetical protein VJ866_09145 [Pyrinomonadaceae bacterium]|nr:hypothetical protein [Pyrinomonadaceae bacterium]